MNIQILTVSESFLDLLGWVVFHSVKSLYTVYGKITRISKPITGRVGRDCAKWGGKK